MRLTEKMLKALRKIHGGGYWEDRAAGYVRYQSLVGPCSIHGQTILGLTRQGLIQGVPGTWELALTEKGEKILSESVDPDREV